MNQKIKIINNIIKEYENSSTHFYSCNQLVDGYRNLIGSFTVSSTELKKELFREDGYFSQYKIILKDFLNKQIELIGKEILVDYLIKHELEYHIDEPEDLNNHDCVIDFYFDCEGLSILSNFIDVNNARIKLLKQLKEYYE